MNDRQDASTNPGSDETDTTDVARAGGTAESPVALDRARAAADGVGSPIDRIDRVPLPVAAGRVTADALTAARAVPRADLAAGETIVPANARLDPSGLALAKAAGVDEASVRQRPTVGVLPTGSALVQRDPGPDERVETTGFLLTHLAEQWGATVTYRNVVGDARPSLRAAIQRDLTRDALVVTGVDPDGPVREVVADLGTIHVDSLAADPGGDVGLATIQDRPILLLPSRAADCLVGAVRVLRPLLGALDGAPLGPVPTRRAELGVGLTGARDRTTFVPVRIDDGTAQPVGDPEGTRSSERTDLADVDAGESVAADGWVTVDGGASLDPGETVGVEVWRGR